MKTLNFITGNKNKLSEVRAILGDAVVVDNKSVDVPEIQGTIEEIAKEKCRRAADVVCVFFTDSVHFNGGFCAWWGGKSSWIGINIHSVVKINIKDAYVYHQVGGPVLTEDTALEFHAYKGLPGPYMYVNTTAYTPILPTDYIKQEDRSNPFLNTQ